MSVGSERASSTSLISFVNLVSSSSVGATQLGSMCSPLVGWLNAFTDRRLSRRETMKQIKTQMDR
jgi:hypothetical protein